LFLFAGVTSHLRGQDGVNEEKVKEYRNKLNLPEKTISKKEFNVSI